MSLNSINPATGVAFRLFPEMTASQWDAILSKAHAASLAWRKVSWAERTQKMKVVGQFLEQHQDNYARLMAGEMGKPLEQGKSEAVKCALTCRYYAEHAEAFLAPESVSTEARKSYVAFQPLGVILAVMPWNFPFWQAIRCAVPALMAGNAVVLKHASTVSECALSLEKLFQEAGFPNGLFRTLLVSSKNVGKIIAHPLVRAVSLTGSTEAGRAVAAQAGQSLKKTVLELGGSDPYVVLADADLELAAEACVASRLVNSGQSCVAAKRFIVVKPVLERFTALFVEKMKAKKMGPPLEPGVDIGPLARRDLRDELHRQVQASVTKGAKVLLGGRIPPGPGAFYPPTVLTKVKKGMPAYDEEMFGPVAAIIQAKDEAQAIHIANDSPFGLGAAVFTRDLERGERIAAEQLEAGACFVNGLVRSDSRLPFGGVKQSGYGRELACFGIREFVNIKTVYIH